MTCSGQGGTIFLGDFVASRRLKLEAIAQAARRSGTDILSDRPPAYFDDSKSALGYAIKVSAAYLPLVLHD